jgi:hypothetical protein
MASVPANVLIVMDDSGSMDWQLLIPSSDQGGFVLNNSPAATRSERAESHTYLYELRSNTYPTSSIYGRVLPTEAALEANPDTVDNEYGVWRARSLAYNSLYYNPEVTYAPWTGEDVVNAAFTHAVPTAVRLDPVDPSDTIDITQPVSYLAQGVPRWDQNGGITSVDVDDFYIPMYYTTTAPDPLVWDDQRTRVEIRVGSGPLAGDMFAGGRNRVDCEIADGDPLDCTYAEEIQNFANWFQFYRSREYVTKGGIGSVVAQIQTLRVGYDTISARTSEDIQRATRSYCWTTSTQSSPAGEHLCDRPWAAPAKPSSARRVVRARFSRHRTVTASRTLRCCSPTDTGTAVRVPRATGTGTMLARGTVAATRIPSPRPWLMWRCSTTRQTCGPPTRTSSRWAVATSTGHLQLPSASTRRCTST